MASSNTLTDEEARLYDRQIRLWGVDAQRRMRDAMVLIIGMKGLNSEVCKNIVLAGINSVTILDHENVTELDLGAQIFLEDQDIGKNRADASIRNLSILNPHVHLTVDQDDVATKQDAFFEQFNVVCATNCSLETLKRIDNICRKKNIYFFGAETFGYFGFFFEDLVSYTFTRKPAEESDTKNKAHDAPTAQPEAVTFNYCSLESALNASWTSLKRNGKLYFGISILYEFHKTHKRFPAYQNLSEIQQIAREQLQKHGIDSGFLDSNYLQNLTMNATSELAPVCAIIGGILGQEIIKVISGKDEALNNFFFYNGLDLRRPGDVIRITSDAK